MLRMLLLKRLDIKKIKKLKLEFGKSSLSFASFFGISVNFVSLNLESSRVPEFSPLPFRST
jgi:hypothetical protein